MLALQTDYLTIDVERVDYEPSLSVGISELWMSVKQDYSELLWKVTIQCNWKLRRTRFTTRVVKNEETENISSYYDLESYDTVYNPLRIISDLWYEVPTDRNCHKIVKKAIEEFYQDEEKEGDVKLNIPNELNATLC